MKKINLIPAILSFTLLSASAQTYLISQGGTVTTCSGNFYDPGGQSGNYGGITPDSITFCSGSSDQLTVAFSSITLGTEVCNGIFNDELRVYDGSSSNDTLIGFFTGDGFWSGGDGMAGPTGWSSSCGFNSGDGTVVTSTNGCLTFVLSNTMHWLMDSWDGICYVTDPPGWDATISCTPATNVDFTYSTPPCGGGNVTFTDLSVNAFAWRWQIDGSFNFTQNPTVTLTPGTYDVILEVNHSVCLTKQIIVPSSGAPVANYTVSGPTTFCQGQSVQFTATTAGSYLWSTGDTTQAITVTASGNIFLIVSNACGSDTSSTTVVDVTPGPGNAVSLSGDTLLCPGDSVTLIASPGDSYIWSTSATTQSIVVVSAGNYTVTVTGSCGNTVSEPVNVYAFPNPVTPVISVSGPTTFCTGDSVTLSSSAAFSYQWSTSATTQDITVSAGGNFDVTVTDSSGCEATAISIAVTVNPLYNISSSTAICAGDSIFLQGNYQTAAGTYYDTLSSVDGCDSVIATTLSVNQSSLSSVQAAICSGDSILLEGNYQTAAGTYYDSLTSVNGCDSVIATTLSVNQSAFSSVQAAICSGDSIMLEGNYQTAAGIYYDTLTSVNGCDSVITTTLTVNLTPATPVISVSGSANLCQGDSIILTSSTANSYSWSTSAITQSIVVTTAGDYSITITDINGCSASSAATTVTVTNPITGFSADNTVFYLPNATVTFTATTSGTIISYLWDFGDGNTSAQSNPSHSYTAPGNYSISLTVTDNTGCTETLTMSGYVWVEQVFNASALSTGTSENLTGTSFADPLNGCSSIEDGNVLFTSDGGVNWTISNTGFTGILNSIYLIGNSAYIAGTNGYAAFSINGGSSWSTYSLGTNVTFYDVFFVNSNLGYLAGANGTIYIYNGTSWVVQNTGTTVDFYSVFGIGNVAYAAGADGIIYFYNGSTWTPLSSGVNIVLNGIYFVNANLGYAVGASGTILMTSDGGTSWQNIFSGLNDNFNSIVAGGTDTLWAVGTGGIVYQSVNAGLNWTRFSIGNQTDLSSIRYVGQTGYIVGKGGQAYQFGSIPSVGMSEISTTENNIKIYPNPFSASFTVELEKVENSEFVIFDMLGQIIKNVKINSTKFNIDREEMKSGMYFYQLKNNESVTNNGKLLIE